MIVVYQSLICCVKMFADQKIKRVNNASKIVPFLCARMKFKTAVLNFSSTIHIDAASSKLIGAAND
jgi:hypothetical protein